MITIGIVGTRRRDSDEDRNMTESAFRAVKKFFQDNEKETEFRIVSGGCRQGGDRFAEYIARLHGLTIIIHYPDWLNAAMRPNFNTMAAGFIRNSKIAEDCDVLIAVVADNRKGGTEDTVKKVEKLGKHVVIV